ncbi:MAG: ATP-binding protein [Caldilineaceae bacterium]
MSLGSEFVSALVQLFTAWALKGTWQHVKQTYPKVKQIMSVDSILRYRSHFYRTDLVNRDKEIRAIRSAIEDNSSRILFLKGSGGAGKTRLLEEAVAIIAKSKSGLHLRTTGVLDLFYIDHRDPTALQVAIAESLDPEHEFFEEFLELVEAIRRRQITGFMAVGSAAEQRAVEQLFAQCYSTLAQTYRPVILLDTVENIDTSIENTVSHTDVATDYSDVGNWLIRQTAVASNTVYVLAGRTLGAFERQLEETHIAVPGKYEKIVVDGLTRGDFSLMLRHLLDKSELEDAVAAQSDLVWKATSGLPVNLALFLELISLGKLEITQLLELANSQQTPSKWLIPLLFSHTNLETRTFYFLSLARRGLDPELFRFLEPEMELTEVVEFFDYLRALNIIKSRPGQSDLFLHDAIYELFDEHTDKFEENRFWYSRIDDFYQEKLAYYKQGSKEWINVFVRLIYYKMHVSPITTYETIYLTKREEAINTLNFELDSLLRNQVFQIFRSAAFNQIAITTGFSVTTAIHDDVLLLIEALVGQGKYSSAIEIAEDVLQHLPAHYVDEFSFAEYWTRTQSAKNERTTRGETVINADDIYWGKLLAYYGETLHYVNDDLEFAYDVLSGSIAILMNKMDIYSDSPHYIRALARAYNSLGYLHRIKGQYGAALYSYQNAVDALTDSDITDELASILNDTAFHIALLGEISKAEQYITEAIHLRQKFTKPFQLALSYNTRGQIMAMKREYHKARLDCHHALNMFLEIGEVRGIGLAHSALAFVWIESLKSGKFAAESIDELEEVLIDVEMYLKNAADIFRDQVNEPVRLWQVYERMGELYLFWAEQFRDQDETQYLLLCNEAESVLRQALSIAQDYGLEFCAAAYDSIANIAGYIPLAMSRPFVSLCLWVYCGDCDRSTGSLHRASTMAWSGRRNGARTKRCWDC